MLLGEVYAPIDIYYSSDPWQRLAAERGVQGARNPILSDVAFQGLPWRAAVQESVSRGRLPLWNRFLLAGNPLLGAGQAAVFHPSTWLGLFLPLPLSQTFSATFTIFLSLLCAALYFRDFFPAWPPALAGSVGWGFSTSLLFWNGYAEGLSLAAFPLLLLGVRRLARERDLRAAGLTTAALVLILAGGQPETFFFCAVAAGVAFLWELKPGGISRSVRAIGLAATAAALALLLAAPALFPLAGSVVHSAQYRSRRSAPGRQSVSAPEAARRLLPAWLPFSHGIYGRSPVQGERLDGSGMPLGYAGALLFPLALLAFAAGPAPRGRILFLGFAVAGLLCWASAPGLLDLLTRLPGFSLARYYRLAFLAGLGLSGLAAFGADYAQRRPRALALACAVTVLLLGSSFLLARVVFRERALSESFVRTSFAAELVPIVLLGAVAALDSKTRRAAGVAVALLAAQRAFEMGGSYPTLPASLLAPPLPTLAALPRGSEPYRVCGVGDVFRPNAAALYGLEDARGYESIALDRFVETYPLWCEAGAAFNRIDRLDLPFLAFLNVRFAIASPGAASTGGWIERARGPEMSLFENPSVLPRAFVPRRVLFEPDPARRLAAMTPASDFGRDCWVSGAGTSRDNGAASLSLSAEGTDLLITAAAQAPALVATSVPDWPGWRVNLDGRAVAPVTVNHAFVGFWLPEGRHEVRLTYCPASVRWGFAAFALGAAVCAGIAFARRVSGGTRAPAAS